MKSTLLYLRQIILGCSVILAPHIGNAATDYPNRDIRLIVPWNAGGSVDLIARFMAKEAEQHGINLIVENVPGAGSSIGLSRVANSEPDGYTVGLASTSMLALMAQGLTQTRNEQFTYLNLVSIESYALFVPSAASATTLTGFLQYMEERPGKVSIATAGSNNVPHILANYTAAAAKVDYIQVPYPGGAKVLADLAGGQVHAGILKPVEGKSFMDSGLIKAIGLYSEKRIPEMPDVPTFSEHAVDVFADGKLIQMGYLVGPDALPQQVTQKLISIFQKIMAGEEFKRFARDSMFTVTDLSGAELQTQVDEVLTTLGRIAPKLLKKD